MITLGIIIFHYHHQYHLSTPSYSTTSTTKIIEAYQHRYPPQTQICKPTINTITRKRNPNLKSEPANESVSWMVEPKSHIGTPKFHIKVI